MILANYQVDSNHEGHREHEETGLLSFVFFVTFAVKIVFT
jgi:hypothetical protein